MGLKGNGEGTAQNPSVAPEALLRLITDDLSSMLGQVGHLSESLMARPVSLDHDLKNLYYRINSAIELVDNYRLGLSLNLLSGNSGYLTSVPASSVMYEVIRGLEPLARANGIKLMLNVTDKLPPIVANQEVLRSALTSVGFGLLNFLVSSDNEQTELSLDLVQKSEQATIGWYWQGDKLSAHDWRASKRAVASGGRPGLIFTNHSSGIFIGDFMLKLLNSELKTTKRFNRPGLMASFKLTSQLSLV
jgi:hypothetical protein